MDRVVISFDCEKFLKTKVNSNVLQWLVFCTLFYLLKQGLYINKPVRVLLKEGKQNGLLRIHKVYKDFILAKFYSAL